MPSIDTKLHISSAWITSCNCYCDLCLVFLLQTETGNSIAAEVHPRGIEGLGNEGTHSWRTYFTPCRPSTQSYTYRRLGSLPATVTAISVLSFSYKRRLGTASPLRSIREESKGWATRAPTRGEHTSLHAVHRHKATHIVGLDHFLQLLLRSLSCLSPTNG